jgi:hypothetical protein
MPYPEFLIDKRVVQRNIAKGLVDPAQLARDRASLPDSQPNAEYVSPAERGAASESDETED